MSDAAPVQSAHALLRDTEALLARCNLSLANPLVYSNAGALGDHVYRRWLHWCNTARDVAQPPVLLGRYGDQTYLDGSGPPHLLTDGVLVREQLMLGPDLLADNFNHLQSRRSLAVEIERPCVLACHGGSWVWGHWLIDTLPKILLAERAYPQRFTFAVPHDITDPRSSRPFVRSVLGSLAAYGISESRLLRVRQGIVYRFLALFDVIGLRSDGPHPGVLQVLRTICDRKARPRRRGLTAVMRAAGDIRRVSNGAGLSATLQAHGAAALDPHHASFAQQMQAFRDSDAIVGDLGSNLAACVYMQPGARVVTLGPCGWYDSYFVGLFQRLGLHHADVRGISLPTPGENVDHATYVVDPAHLEEGMRAALTPQAGAPQAGALQAGAPQAGQLRGGPVQVDGRTIARSLGPVLLRIDFGARGNAARHRMRGFSPPEALRTWSIGPECELVVTDVVWPDGDLWLEIEGIGFVARPHLVSRPFAVAVNGVCLAEFDIDELTHVHVFIPEAVRCRSRALTIRFEHKLCPSPKSMGLSNDDRPLGFMFETIHLRRPPTN